MPLKLTLLGHIAAMFLFSNAVACDPIDPAIIAKRVQSIAVEERLDPSLALAVAAVESNLGGNQVSNAGAVGIMQLMPGTAADYGVTDRCDAEANIRAGVKYLKKLYDEFDDPLLMLAAYNAGPNRVYQKGGIPEFEETANYVVKVMNRWKLSGKLKARAGTASVSTPTAQPDTGDTTPWRDAHVWNVE